MRAPGPPSGRQFTLRWGDQEAVAVEIGGGLRSYRVGGEELLDTYSEQEIAPVARGQLLIPWPNRLRDGSYTWAGRRLQVPLSEPALMNAIHGLVRWRPWRLIAQAESSLRLQHHLNPTPGYPFTLISTVDYELSERGLTVRIGAENGGEVPLPYGAGQHPYLRLSENLIDDAELLVPAATHLLTDARQIPVGESEVEGETDFRRLRRIGTTVLDTAYTDLERGEDGLARILYRLGGRTLTLWLDPGFPHVMVFTGDTFDGARRRRGLGLEPMTCAPNAFQSGRDLIRLGPGELSVASWGLHLDAS